MSHEYEVLSRRIERLERRNRFLTALLLAFPLLAILGWQASPTVHDLVKVRSLEVVDERGVPMVILGTGRKGEGGSITLRDSLGEKRGWWQVTPQGSNLTMSAENGDNASTAGFGVDPRAARLSLISPKGASVSASIEADQPRIDVYDPNGKVLFGAPWKAAK